MGVIQIRKAEKKGARLVIGLAGASGSGKTYTALLMAYGLVNGNASKIGFLDAENKRGSLYAEILKKPDGSTDHFLIGDLYAPFSPERYAKAIKEFETAGIEVLIIDSVTHEWEGLGGCEEIAYDTTFKVADWKKAKREHKRFMNALLQSDMHIIVCLRAREKTLFTDPKKPVSIGMQPIQEKNFMFEMTASLMLSNEGRSHSVLKCPEELRPVIGKGSGFIGYNEGLFLRQWVDGMKPESQLTERIKNKLILNTEQGLEHIKTCWNMLKPEQQKEVGEDFRSMVFESAKGYDLMREAEKTPQELTADIDRKINNIDKPKQPDDHAKACVRLGELSEENKHLVDKFLAGRNTDNMTVEEVWGVIDGVEDSIK